MKSFAGKICSAEAAAELVQNGEILGISGFTLSGYPKLVPQALARRAERLHAAGEPFKVAVFSGASTGDSCDGVLVRANAISFRAPYQSNSAIRAAANAGTIKYMDEHLGIMGVRVREGVYAAPTTAIVEAAAVTDDGKVFLSTSGGNSAAYLQGAERIIIELNTRYEKLLGLHDTFLPDLAPGAAPIPIRKVGDRAGADFVQVDPKKIVAVVLSEAYDEVKFTQSDSVAETIAGHILEFLNFERKKGRLPGNLAYQSGVGNVANAVLGAMAADKNLDRLDLFTEVIQEACLPLLKHEKLGTASGTSLMLSPAAQDEFFRNIDVWRHHFVLRQQEVSNSPEVIRRVGIISMNTALECDILGNVNSSHVCGSSIMNGIGGAADFARNARLGFFMTPSVAKGGSVSSIVPLVSHVDHTEHDTMVFVTERGLADLRGLSAAEKAELVINNCAHPDYRDALREALKYGLATKGHHIPCSLDHAFDFHRRYLETGSMK